MQRRELLRLGFRVCLVVLAGAAVGGLSVFIDPEHGLLIAVLLSMPVGAAFGFTWATCDNRKQRGAS